MAERRKKPRKDRRQGYLDMLKSAARSVQTQVEETLEDAKKAAGVFEAEAKKRILLTMVPDNGNLQAKALRLAAETAPVATFDVITSMAARNPEGVAWFMFGPDAAKAVNKTLSFADDVKRTIRAQFPGSKRTEESIARQKELQRRLRERAANAIKPKPGEITGERLERMLDDSDRRRERVLRMRAAERQARGLPTEVTSSSGPTTPRDASSEIVTNSIRVQQVKLRQKRALERKNALRVTGSDPAEIRAANQAFRNAVAAGRIKVDREDDDTNKRGSVRIRSYTRSDGTRVRAFRQSR